MSETTKIAILGTGGTIAGLGSKDGANLGYQAGQIAVADLLDSIQLPGLPLDMRLCVQQVAQLDSKDMDVPVWQALVRACEQWLAREDVAGLVITHGTDTLEETAWFLQRVLQPLKPVVLTCAMRPASALSADGPANLRDAIAAVPQLPAGVWLVAAGEVHGAQWVHKAHPYRLNAFVSTGQAAAAWVEEGRVRWQGLRGDWPVQPPVRAQAWQTAAADWPWVEVIASGAAAKACMVDALVHAGIDGIVVAATGNGSVHRHLLQALQRAQAQGVHVVLTTRCEQGQVVSSAGASWCPVSALSPIKARIDLMLDLLECRCEHA